MKRPLILVSNDDGIFAKGINALVDILKPMADLVVVAPDAPRSGAGCSMTVTQPVTCKPLRSEVGLKMYSCSGTPTDCVKLALDSFVDRCPDLVIGGINHGDNSAVNVHYSGTMGVVLEGCMKGIPSVGFSLCNHDADADFTPLIPYVQRIVSEMLKYRLPDGVCLNVNFPDAPAFAGIKVCRQAKGKWEHEWVQQKHPRGGTYYWLTGEFARHDDGVDSDHWALEQGYVAITPTRVDVTDYDMVDEMKYWDLYN